MTSLADSSAPADATPPKRQHYGVTFAVLALAGMTFSLLQSLVAPALPEIQRDLHTSATAVAWILTAYLLSASVLTPIVGRLGDMFGKERTLVAVLVVLSLGTLLAALAQDIGTLIAARIIQGSGGAIFPLAFGIIRDEFPRERVVHGIGLISALLGIGGGFGIVLAGPIVDQLSYHWLFWFPLVVLVLATAMAVLFIPESPVRVPGRINWGGAALLSAWLVCLLLAISEASSWGWLGGRTLGLLAAAAALLVLWVVYEQRAPEPLVDMAMMCIRGVWTVNAAAFLIGVGMFSSFILIPQFVAMPTSTGYGFGANVTQAGLFLLPSTLGMLLGGPLSGRLAGRSPRLPLTAGSIVSAAGFLLLALVHGERWQIYVGATVMGLGLGLAFASLANLVVNAVRADQTGVATGMNTVMRSVGGAVGTQLGASVIAATVVGSAPPTEQGFIVAFLIAGGACALAAPMSLAVPQGT